MHDLRETITNKQYLIGDKKNSNNNNKTITNNESEKVREVQNTAAYIMDKLKAPEQSREFYLKAAWHISRGRLDWMVGTALECGRNPGAYFNFLVRKELSNREEASCQNTNQSGKSFGTTLASTVSV